MTNPENLSFDVFLKDKSSITAEFAGTHVPYRGELPVGKWQLFRIGADGEYRRPCGNKLGTVDDVLEYIEGLADVINLDLAANSCEPVR